MGCEGGPRKQNDQDGNVGSRDQKYGGKVKVNLKVKVPSFKGLPSESNIKVKMRMQASERQNVIHHQIDLVRTRPEVWTLENWGFYGSE